MLVVGKSSSAVFVFGAAGCAGGSAEVSVLENVDSAALAVALGVCAGSRRGFRVCQRQGGGVGNRAGQGRGFLA